MRTLTRPLLSITLLVATTAGSALAACSETTTTAAPAADAATNGDDASSDDGASGSPDSGPSSDSGGDPPACDPAKPSDCASDEYCALFNCMPGTGVCTPRPAESGTDLRFDVCGCDGIEYWNETIAGSRGVSVQSGCVTSTLKTCGGAANTKCPAGTYCQYSGFCDDAGASPQKGICWGVPTTCDTIKGSWSACGAEAGAPATCTNLCVVTKNEKPFGGAPLGTCH